MKLNMKNVKIVEFKRFINSSHNELIRTKMDKKEERIWDLALKVVLLEDKKLLEELAKT